MGFVMLINVLFWFSGCILFPLFRMLLVCRNATAFRWKSVGLGFGPQVFLQWFLWALVGPVVVLFCFVIPFFWLTRGLILMVVFFNVSSFVVIVFFV